MAKKKAYGLPPVAGKKTFTAPALPYLPQDPRRYNPGIGLIGCGGITGDHLREYRKAGYRVLALCDLNRDKAEGRRKQYFPKADIYTDYREVLARDDIQVIDAATHPGERVPIIRDAINAGKHILSQKPFVESLKVGEDLVARAEQAGVKLAVNQNGRWAPHFSYMRQALAKGLIGTLSSADFVVHWDHNWTADTVFNDIHHLTLYDFGIHWFDMTTQFFGDRKAETVYARIDRSDGQRATPPLVASVIVGYKGGQARINYNADCGFGAEDTTTLIGEKGTLRATGRDFNRQRVTLHSAKGKARPKLTGRWFANGFHATMGELLRAIEDKRDPSNSARSTLRSLELCFAALKSADTGKPVKVGAVRRMPK